MHLKFGCHCKAQAVNLISVHVAFLPAHMHLYTVYSSFIGMMKPETDV
jgi:hypothetical protein